MSNGGGNREPPGFGSGNREGLRLSLEGYLTASSPAGVPTITTPTLTPTTLRNIEQMFLDQDQEGTSSSNHHENAAHFVPPVVDNSLKEETDGVNDLSTPTIANVILDMQGLQEGEDSPNKQPMTLENVVRQLQESEKESSKKEEKPILNVPSFVISKALNDRPTLARPTSLTITPSPLPSAKLKRKTLHAVINQLSPSLSKSTSTLLTAAGQVPSTSNHVPTPTMPTPALPSFLNPALKSPDKSPIHLLPSEPTLLHSLASVSAIQHPLPVLPTKPDTSIVKPEPKEEEENRGENALNLTLNQRKSKNNIDLLLDASKKLPSPSPSPSPSSPPIPPPPPLLRLPSPPDLTSIKELHKKTSNPAKRKKSGKHDSKKEQDLSMLTDEERRKFLRRQRNKEAAARCRKRRLDQTVSLEEQVSEWERKKADMHQEIVALKAEQASLEAILCRHKGSNECKGSGVSGSGSKSKKTKHNNNHEQSKGRKSKKTSDNNQVIFHPTIILPTTISCRKKMTKTQNVEDFVAQILYSIKSNHGKD